MIASVILAALLAAQPETSLPGPDLEMIEHKQVSYDALINGETQRAIAALEARLLDEPADPALLINLGAAYAQAGRTERAAAAYRAAIDSPTRYQLELADGRWLDSRRVARMALDRLATRAELAAR